MENLIDAFWGVTISIGVSALIFVGANRLFDFVVDRWFVFQAITGAIFGTIFSTILIGNRLVKGSALLLVVLTVLAFSVLTSIPQLIEKHRTRIFVGLLSGTLVGVIIASFLKESVNPQIQTKSFIFTVLMSVLVYSLPSAIIKKFRFGGLLFFLVLGCLIGGWLLSEIGNGSKDSTYLLTVVPFALIGLALNIGPKRNLLERNHFQRRTRVGVFLGPALFFVTLGLIIPLARTIYLSLHGLKGREWAGLTNYGEILTNDSSIDLRDWSNIFTSRLFIIALILLAIGSLAGVMLGKKRGRIIQPLSLIHI